MIKISKHELKEILKRHKKWLGGEANGERADLQFADLYGVNLTNVNLQFADLSGADLSEANLQKADLQNTNLQGANLQNSYLSYALLQRANLHRANLYSAGLMRANLQNSDLSNADLSYADLRYADLREANLQDTKLLKTILYKANVECITRQWLIIVDHIGSRKAKTLYFADIDNVRCGCWNDYSSGTLDEFKVRINEVYPADSKDRFCQYHRIEYLSAIKMFENMRKEYLKSKENNISGIIL